jgi:predicted secreted protein
MDIVSGVVLFLLIWWTVVFCVLPLGNQAGTTQTGHAASAPARPRIGYKLLLTSVIAVVLWLPCQWGLQATLRMVHENARAMHAEDERKEQAQ